LKSLPLVVAFLAHAVAAVAAEPDCGALPTQSEINRCAADALARLDADLDQAYREAMTRLADDATSRERLAAAQDAWLTYRDADCAFVALPTEGGSVQPMVTANCRGELVRTRLARLRGWLDCPEGDLTCPLPPKAP
jgi:uncharacterized protein YecT (DUF1311 family)